MLPLSALSRRALVAAATALMAVAPTVDAAEKKPLAFVGGTVTKVAIGPDGTTFQWDVQALLSQPEPAPRFEADLSTTVNSGVDESRSTVRSQIAAILRNNAFSALEAEDRTVPENRIAVVLL
jgi:hypothetical protein